VIVLDDRLELALSARRAGPALAAALGLAPHGLACTILDAKCDSEQGCSVLYRLGDRLVVGTTVADGHTPGEAPVAEPLGLRVFVFPHDPALPGLARLLDPAAMGGTLAAALGERLRVTRVTRMRYRPGRRCTLRADGWVRPPDGGRPRRRTLYAKVYHDTRKAASVWQEMRQLSGTEPVRSGRLRLAAAAAWLPEVPMVVQEPVTGVGLDALLGPLADPATRPDPRGVRGVLDAAGALAALHTAELASARPRPAGKEITRMARRARDNVAGIDPDLAGRMVALAERQGQELGSLPEVLGLVHGDCKPTQFLLGDGPVTLLDFDHCGLADPAGDVGNFAASLRQLAVKQRVDASGSAASAERSRWLADLEGSFVEEYERRTGGGGPALRQRVAWQERTALLRKAIRMFARSPRSPMAAALVDAAGSVQEMERR